MLDGDDWWPNRSFAGRSKPLEQNPALELSDTVTTRFIQSGKRTDGHPASFPVGALFVRRKAPGCSAIWLGFWEPAGYHPRSVLNKSLQFSRAEHRGRRLIFNIQQMAPSIARASFSMSRFPITASSGKPVSVSAVRTSKPPAMRVLKFASVFAPHSSGNWRARDVIDQGFAEPSGNLTHAVGLDGGEFPAIICGRANPYKCLPRSDWLHKLFQAFSLRRLSCFRRCCFTGLRRCMPKGCSGCALDGTRSRVPMIDAGRNG